MALLPVMKADSCFHFPSHQAKLTNSLVKQTYLWSVWLYERCVCSSSGYGGNTVKGIERRTGAKVDVLAKAAENSMVVIRGRSEECQVQSC